MTCSPRVELRMEHQSQQPKPTKPLRSHQLLKLLACQWLQWQYQYRLPLLPLASLWQMPWQSLANGSQADSTGNPMAVRLDRQDPHTRSAAYATHFAEDCRP